MLSLTFAGSQRHCDGSRRSSSAYCVPGRRVPTQKAWRPNVNVLRR